MCWDVSCGLWAEQQGRSVRLSARVCSLFQGGSPLSPAAVISQETAQQQAVALAKEVGCPTSSTREMASCLRQKPSDVLNDAQTKVGTCVQVGKGHFTNGL